MAEQPLNDFGAEAERQVLGTLGQPRSVEEIVRYHLNLSAFLNSRPQGPLTAEEVRAILERHEANGLCRRLELDDPTDLAQHSQDHPDTITLAGEKVNALALRTRERPDRYRAGEYWALTQAGLDKLTGPVPNEPAPKTGQALRETLEHNVRLAQEAVDLEHGAEGRTDEQVAAAEETLARAQAALEEAQE